MAMKKLSSALYRAGRCSCVSLGVKLCSVKAMSRVGSTEHDNYDEEQKKHAEIFIYPWL